MNEETQINAVLEQLQTASGRLDSLLKDKITSIISTGNVAVEVEGDVTPMRMSAYLKALELEVEHYKSAREYLTSVTQNANGVSSELGVVTPAAF